MSYPHPLKSLTLITNGLMLLVTLPVHAKEPEIKKDSEPTQEVNIRVVANVKAYQQPNKIQKSVDSINKEQVSNIRDLTRYDPGVSVVEQGKGATKGYAIYGVDRNRVAINLDGLEQAESFELDRQATSGARLEPEYEHITQVDISKGADSVTNGSGALGGAVSLRTKSVKDIVKPGEEFGLRYKTGYFDKDSQWLNSFAIAADYNRFDALLIHTRRKGKEYKANIKNAPGRTFLSRDLIPRKENFHLDDPYLINGNEFQDKSIYLSSKDIVGENRLVPDPRDTKSESTLFKVGLKLDAKKEHYLGIVSELENKLFNIHVKSESDFCELKGQLVTCKDNYRPMRSLASQKFTNELHQRHRVGLEYEYRPLDPESNWVDRIKLAVDRQYFRVDLDNSIRDCTTAPFTDPNCRPKYMDERLVENGFDFKQKQHSIRLVLDKWFDTSWGEHNVRLNSGISKNNYTINARNSAFYIDYLYPYRSVRPTHKNCINIKNKDGEVIPICENQSIEFKDGGPPINQRKFYLSLSDQITFNRWLSVDLGVRWEINRFSSKQKQLPFDNYRNGAYHLGFNFYPTNYLTIGYKYTTGFRIPSAGEIYGSLSENNYRKETIPYVLIDFKTKLKPESSQMHEISARLNTDWVNGNVALFSIDYKNLIGRGKLNRVGAVKSYFERNYNLQQTRVHGASLNLNADLHKIWSSIPDGLSATFSITSIKLRASKVINPEIYSDYMTYPLDSLQPLKIVYGLDYNAPNGKWGISHRVSYSKGKSEKELFTHGKWSGNTKVNNKPVGRHLSKKWSSVDILGYWKPYKNFTIHAGVYNLFNYQYTSWESTRQTISSSNSPSIGRAQLAPGRNFSLSLEFVF